MIYFFKKEKAQTLARLASKGVGLLSEGSGQEVLFVKVPAQGIEAADSSTGVAGTQECNVITIAKGGETTVSKDKVEVFNTHSTAIDGNTIAQCWYRNAKWVVDDTLPVEFQLFKANSSVDEFNATSNSASSGLFPKHEGSKDPDANQVDFSASTDSARVYNLSADYKINNGDIVLAWKQDGIWVTAAERGEEYFLAKCFDYRGQVVEHSTGGVGATEQIFIQHFGGLSIEDDMWDNSTGSFRTVTDSGYAGHTETGKEIEFHEDEIVIVKKNENYDPSASHSVREREFIVYKLWHAEVRNKLVGQHNLLCHINGHSTDRARFPAYEYEDMHDALFVQGYTNFTVTDGTHMWEPTEPHSVNRMFYEYPEQKNASFLKAKYVLEDGTDAPVYSLYGVGNNSAECLPTTVTSSSQDLDFYYSSGYVSNQFPGYTGDTYSKMDRTDSLSSTGLANIRNGDEGTVEEIDTGILKHRNASAGDTWKINWVTRFNTDNGGSNSETNLSNEFKSSLLIGKNFRKRSSSPATLTTYSMLLAGIRVTFTSYDSGTSINSRELMSHQDIFNTSLSKSHNIARTASDTFFNGFTASNAATAGLTDHPNIQQKWECEVNWGTNPDFTSYTATP